MITRNRHDQKSLSSYLRDRGIVWEEVEEEHDRKPAGRARDSYAEASTPQQCKGMVESNTAHRLRQGSDISDRCRTKTKHPSGYCPKHRRQQ